jgi:hypothetical protein
VLVAGETAGLLWLGLGVELVPPVIGEGAGLPPLGCPTGPPIVGELGPFEFGAGGIDALVVAAPAVVLAAKLSWPWSLLEPQPNDQIDTTRLTVEICTLRKTAHSDVTGQKQTSTLRNR